MIISHVDFYYIGQFEKQCVSSQEVRTFYQDPAFIILSSDHHVHNTFFLTQILIFKIFQICITSLVQANQKGLLHRDKIDIDIYTYGVCICGDGG